MNSSHSIPCFSLFERSVWSEAVPCQDIPPDRMEVINMVYDSPNNPFTAIEEPIKARVRAEAK